MKSNKNYSLDTRCVHSGIEDNEVGAVVTPIYQTSTFKFKDVDHGARLFKGEEQGYIYTRMRNPTVEACEMAVASLEGGAKALGCGSGMAATNLLLATLLNAGDHVVCSESVYGPTSTLLSTVYSRFGIKTSFVDTSDLEAIKNAINDKTKLIFIETPGNPTLVMSDIQAIADIAKPKGIKVAVDNTFMSPILQRPFELGADYIIHSMTKFLNGHGDVVAGMVVVKNEEEYPTFRKVLNHIGGVIDPFNSFLVHRGIKTLKIRMERHNENAMKIAEFLENHPKVDWVRFPGLKSHPQYEIGQKQMSGPGGMISFELKGGLDAGKILMNNVEVWQLAVSLGGVESLIQHPASMTHAIMPKEQREKAQITDGLVRLSVGIEDVDELIEGLNAGLDKI
ncbi:MAG: PLP-dependent transferase [Chlorobi bacterium]|nr:PLP-dependent transferase [Chlorobiota bacterium]